MSALLELDGVTAGYGGGDVLHELNLRVEEGGITCVVGPNGAGKSTILRLVSGLIRPRLGGVRFRGDSISVREKSWSLMLPASRPKFWSRYLSLAKGLRVKLTGRKLTFGDSYPELQTSCRARLPARKPISLSSYPRLATDSQVSLKGRKPTSGCRYPELVTNSRDRLKIRKPPFGSRSPRIMTRCRARLSGSKTPLGNRYLRPMLISHLRLPASGTRHYSSLINSSASSMISARN